MTMKKEKMSLEAMKSTLSKTLSREEMKEIMAGSGGGDICGFCWDELHAVGWNCYFVDEIGGTICRCGGTPGGSFC